MSNEKPDSRPQGTPQDNFTRAVKTIVNVPKDDVNPKSDAHKRDHKYEEWKCPDCGAKYMRPEQHKHNK